MFQITKRSAKLFSANCIALRKYADSSKVATLKGGENILYSSLQKKFPQAKEIKIKDISGGCGAIFEVFISTTEFKGLSIVKQHQLINEVNNLSLLILIINQAHILKKSSRKHVFISN
uniref:BolA-like protein 3 n=1 Tax=Melanaphis sacchari TaxID=742174 RepID=A0A2H8TY32_9HEMI